MLHTVGFADRALEAKNAQVIGEKQNFDGRLKRIKHELNKQMSDTNEQSGQNMLHPSVLGGPKIDIFEAKC